MDIASARARTIAAGTARIRAVLEERSADVAVDWVLEGTCDLRDRVVEASETYVTRGRARHPQTLRPLARWIFDPNGRIRRIRYGTPGARGRTWDVDFWDYGVPPPPPAPPPEDIVAPRDVRSWN